MNVFRHYCRGCETHKPANAFYASSPRTCKECVKARVNAYRADNLERVQQYDRQRGNLPHRVALRAEYAKTEDYTESHAAAASKWDRDHPDRKRATGAVYKAVRRGKIIQWPVCAIPDCNGEPHAHHPDYSAPLSVVWLCPLHHKQAHALVKRTT